MAKCDFNKVEKKTLLKSHVGIWMFVNLLHIFRTSFPKNTPGGLLLLFAANFFFFPSQTLFY